MKKVRNHKLICLIMAIVVMISGIFLEKIPVNSYFSWEQTDVMSSYDSTLEKETVYKTETLSQREVLGSIRLAKREARRISYRDGSRMTWVHILSVDSLLHSFNSCAWRADDKLYHGTFCSLAILNYIHNQDGEKA